MNATSIYGTREAAGFQMKRQLHFIGVLILAIVATTIFNQKRTRTMDIKKDVINYREVTVTSLNSPCARGSLPYIALGQSVAAIGCSPLDKAEQPQGSVKP